MPALPATCVRTAAALWWPCSFGPSCSPEDSNEVQATRQELADLVGCSPREITIVMKELESLNAVHRARDGRGVRYYVDARFGTHLAGAARDQAQALADQKRPLKLVPVD
jgi:MarR-like DNA-binding transcriptional regulator SgrR of sgrS sRNA